MEPREASRESSRQSQGTTGSPLAARIATFLKGQTCDEYDLWECASALKGCRFSETPGLLVKTLFREGERINIVHRTNHALPNLPPLGEGHTQTREAWLANFEQGNTPSGEGGVWIRPNPTNGYGVSDSSMAHLRFLILEFDRVSLPLQRAFLACLKLPIAAIISSGNRSLHAWVQINAPSLEAFRKAANGLVRALSAYGVCAANFHPSRLSRLPGVIRPNGAPDDNRQKLLYLNSTPQFERILK